MLTPWVDSRYLPYFGEIWDGKFRFLPRDLAAWYCTLNTDAAIDEMKVCCRLICWCSESTSCSKGTFLECWPPPPPHRGGPGSIPGRDMSVSLGISSLGWRWPWTGSWLFLFVRIRIRPNMSRIHITAGNVPWYGSTSLRLLALRDGKNLFLDRVGGGHRAGDVRQAGGGRPSHHLTLQGQGRHSSQVC